MTDQRRLHEEDLALRLAGEALDDGGDPRILEWRAKEARLEQSDDETAATVEAAARFASRIRARLAAQRGQVRRVMESPPWYAADRTDDRAHTAPYFGLPVAAGIGRTLWNQTPDAQLILPAELPARRYLALPVRGRSMEPLLEDGDVILVDRDLAPRRGRIVVARDEDDGYVVKCFLDVAAGSITLQSLNPEYPDCTVPAVSSAILGTVVMAWSAGEGRSVD